MAEQNKDAPARAPETDRAPAPGRPSPTPEPKPAEQAATPTDKPAAKPAAKTGAKPKASTPKRRLAQASESSDPAVHQLLAEQEIARKNGDEDEIERTQVALRDLGFE